MHILQYTHIVSYTYNAKHIYNIYTHCMLFQHILYFIHDYHVILKRLGMDGGGYRTAVSLGTLRMWAMMPEMSWRPLAVPTAASQERDDKTTLCALCRLPAFPGVFS